MTRLAYESHIRRGHRVCVEDYSPVIKLRKSFMVKDVKHPGVGEYVSHLDFITFLRYTLTREQDNLKRCVEWVDQDQAIFRINNKEEFAMEWFKYKVKV